MPVKSLFNPLRYPALQQIVGGKQDADSSLVDDVYDQILLRIVNGELPGGTELKSTLLADELSVSRTPVVQALSRLVVDGIVEQERHRRAVVRSGAEDWLVDAHKVRQLLEPEAAALTAGRVSEDVLADLVMLARDAQPSKQYEWTNAAAHFDYSLHLVIAEFCGNLPMRAAIRRCWSFKRLSYQAGQDTEASLRQGYREHLEILDALNAQNSRAAREAMTRHLESAATLRALERIV